MHSWRKSWTLGLLCHVYNCTIFVWCARLYINEIENYCMHCINTHSIYIYMFKPFPACDHCTLMARSNEWPINSTLQLFAILIIRNYLTVPSDTNAKRDIFDKCVCAQVTTTKLCFCKALTKIGGNRVISDLYVAFNMIRYILCTDSHFLHIYQI